MLRTTLKSLAARRLRLLTTSLAVLLGVAFMAGTLVLTDTTRRAFDGIVADANAGTDVEVRNRAAFDDDHFGAQRPRLDASLVDTIAEVDGVAAAEGDIGAYAQLVDKHGDPLGTPGVGAPTTGAPWLRDAALNPADLHQGRAPRADDEVVIDKGSADEAGFVVGDRVDVLTRTGRQRVAVVGIATFAGQDTLAGAQVTMFTPRAAQAHLTTPGKVDAIKVAAADGVSDAELAARIERVAPEGVEALTGDEITAEAQGEAKGALGFLDTFLVVFAVIALFVGSFIIYNSFSILVAQRAKEHALLRALGARRRQVLGSVLLEAALVGLIASVLGIVAGVGVALGLRSLLDVVGVDLPSGSVVVSMRTVVVSALAGLGVSIASAVLPARRSAQVPPIAALRDVAIDASADSPKRALAGAALGGTGAAVMAAGLFADAGISLVGLGAALVFLGVAVLGPVLARPVSRAIGWPLTRLFGITGNLARQNAVRNPKRTSATASALMIGVALVGLITILGSSAKASVNQMIDESMTSDLMIESQTPGAGGLSPDLARRLGELPEVGAVATLREGPAQVDGASARIVGVNPDGLKEVLDVGVTSGSLEHLGATDIAVAQDRADAEGWELGSKVPVRFAETGVVRLTVAATYAETAMVGDHLLGLPAYEANVADQYDEMVFVNFADGIDADAGRAAVAKVADGYPQGRVMDRTDFKADAAAEVDMLTSLIYALLGLAVFIALLGIANTLALSIFERTRELGLLRAVGMTRGQLRATVRYEAVVISLLGTALGLVIGLGFGWAMVAALDGEGFVSFDVPVGQLAVVAAIAAVAGVVAAILPARRAARLDVLGAITSD